MTQRLSPEEESDLCSGCGMCCNGVMFDNVRLQPGESAKELLSAGLKVRRKKGAHTLQQPCPAFCGTHCAVYEIRPLRCRQFECAQVLRLRAGTISLAEARSAIERVKTKVAEVTRLMDLLGDQNDKRGLAHRFGLIQGQCYDPVWDAEALAHRAALVATMDNLESDLAANFRVKD